MLSHSELVFTWIICVAKCVATDNELRGSIALHHDLSQAAAMLPPLDLGFGSGGAPTGSNGNDLAVSFNNESKSLSMVACRRSPRMATIVDDVTHGRLRSKVLLHKQCPQAVSWAPGPALCGRSMRMTTAVADGRPDMQRCITIWLCLYESL
ncbi:hypothetical protein EDD36DRAFT_26023 [Exophiala viscosa]|uniref:Secreted protein n=1 Tax=Exophiala viscosa TaxID=2486360 RepID=A0AAN6IK71_9EURO|nr:hypothetical protein EDD36DRAFT_26023 [Exophiala viscosa]